MIDYLNSGVNDFGCDLANGTRYILPSLASHKLPVTPSSTTVSRGAWAELSYVYRCGLVRLWRRIDAKITSTPSLKYVLVIATQ